MALNSYLSNFSTVRNIKYLSKAADVLLPQLNDLGVESIEATVDSLQPERSAIGRFFQGIEYKKDDKVLTLSGLLEDGVLVIEVPMINNGWLMPISFNGVFEGDCEYKLTCSRTLLGRSWSCIPDNEQLINRIDAVAPKVRKNHQWLALIVKLNIYYQIGAIDDSHFLVEVLTGMKRGIFDTPKIQIQPYVAAMTEISQAIREAG